MYFRIIGLDERGKRFWSDTRKKQQAAIDVANILYGTSLKNPHSKIKNAIVENSLRNQVYDAKAYHEKVSAVA